MGSKPSRSHKSKNRSKRARRPSRQDKRERRTFFGLWIGLMVGAVLFFVGYVLWSGKPYHGPPKPVAEPKPMQVDRYQEVILYFSDEQAEYLVSEPRTIPWNERPLERARAILEALIRGPETGLQPTIPQGTRVRGVRLGEGGICSVDFTGGIISNHPGGTSSELMTVYSIVESLTKNIPGIQAVQILVEGKQRETLAGHLFIGGPLQPDPRYIKEGRS
jgi:spore germination protein GerM